MELHPVQGQLAVREAHHHAVGRARGDLELGRDRLRHHGQRVVARRRHRGGDPGEDARALMGQLAGAPVHELRSMRHRRPEVLAQRLMAQAHPEHRHLLRGAGPDHLERAPCGARVPGAGGDQHPVHARQIHAAVGRLRHLVVAHHDRLGAHLLEIADDRVHEAVVVVDHQDPCRAVLTLSCRHCRARLRCCCRDRDCPGRCPHRRWVRRWAPPRAPRSATRSGWGTPTGSATASPPARRRPRS